MSRPKLFGHANGARHVDATRCAKAKALIFEEIKNRGQRLFVRFLIGTVNGGISQVCCFAPLSNTLGIEDPLLSTRHFHKSYKGRTRDLELDHYIGIAFFECHCDACQVPPVPTAHVKPSTLPSVDPDFRTSAFFVHPTVGNIVN